MHLILKRVKQVGRDEGGFTMATAILALMVVMLAMTATVTAVNGDISLTSRDLDSKRAYEAAQAGLADYSFHLNKDNGYWAKCTAVPAPSAVNANGSTTNRRNVPGNTGASYALELIPATGKSACSTADPVGSMIEQSGGSIGTFRVRSTGYAGSTKRSIVASFKRASFLDYVYFTQYETSDPVTYGDPATIAGAYQQCEKTYREGRPANPIPNSGGRYCTEIVFADNEQINGPVHTNDELNICGTPTFGRTLADLIEVSSPPVGYRASGGCTANPVFKGTFLTNAPVLTPPSTNDSLRNVQGAALYTGQTKIVLSGANMTVTPNGGSASTTPIPSSGVIYVSNSTTSACSNAYSPFTASYPSTSACGNVYVQGSYSGQLTIAAENDIVVDDDLIRSGSGLLGLIANNFIRVYHPLLNNNTAYNNCGGTSNATGSQSNLRIDAAMLAIQHSFIVDHYNCGAPLGTLTVNGAISQKFRGPVGTVSGGTTQSGYSKNYNYDDRLRYLAPPNFLDPVESAWHMQRQTLDP
jgi:Tfp pilus assembly protein PilX